MIESRENPKVKRWARLARDGRYRRAERRALVEGPHLVASMMDHAVAASAVIVSQSALADAEIRALLAKMGAEPVVLSDRAFGAIADAETPQGIAAEIDIPRPKPVDGSCVFLEGIQDAGNVGAIIRSAGAFALRAVVLDRNCADPWSPKTLRAGMGGHFGLSIAVVEDLSTEIGKFRGTVVCTVAHGGGDLGGASLDGALGWIFGSEAKGVSAGLLGFGHKVRIPTAPGTESLNVAAAAAICFYEAFKKSASSPR